MFIRYVILFYYFVFWFPQITCVNACFINVKSNLVLLHIFSFLIRNWNTWFNLTFDINRASYHLRKWPPIDLHDKSLYKNYINNQVIYYLCDSPNVSLQKYLVNWFTSRKCFWPAVMGDYQFKILNPCFTWQIAIYVLLHNFNSAEQMQIVVFHFILLNTTLQMASHSIWRSSFCKTDMGSLNFLWNVSKKFFTFGLIGLTISDRYICIVPVRGCSMSPTFNPHCSTLLETSTGYNFQRKHA